ncbi:amphoterin-induced protein 2 [Nothobranchius furzeri]|uniref:Adhesion molecule with Ig-like domain 2 n=1 Tax=Nothobranchius furzeri TaxID=105023 RepID=A0A1A8AMG7_NOTFU|nr:adhesion molecule with Ig-like domain 2 [Nothobranchius furzeri]
MHVIASQPFGRNIVGGSCCDPAAAAMVLLLCLGFLPTVATCPPHCLCASDIISCSGCNLSTMPFGLPSYATRLDLSHNSIGALRVDWVSQPFHRLTTLILNRNSISQIEVASFTVTPHLLHLDLSSNQLTVLNSSIFTGLRELKELLLIGNQIFHIKPGAFSDVDSLERLYLSANRLIAFPLELCEEPKGPRNLTFLDLSYNRLSKVPIQSLLSLTHRASVYLQENPLLCDCSLVALLEYWTWKQYSPLVDFRGEYPCIDGAVRDINCTRHGVMYIPLQAQTYRVEPGETLTVQCPGLPLPVQEGLVVFWVTPRTTLNSSAGDPSARRSVLPNGTLEIQGALLEDSGTYGCVVARGRYYHPSESPEVRVLVGNSSIPSNFGLARRSSAEHFNTAFTTLASCVVSIILVLLYLYLTPCRCRETRGKGSRGCGGRAIILCSDPQEVESGQRRSNGKRVAFLEPQAEDSEIGVPKKPAMNLDHVSTEGILKNGSRTVERTNTYQNHVA